MKTITVDWYPPHGTRYGNVADFWYRDTLLAQLGLCDEKDILYRLQCFAPEFTHWRSKQNGRRLKIRKNAK